MSIEGGTILKSPAAMQLELKLSEESVPKASRLVISSRNEIRDGLENNVLKDSVEVFDSTNAAIIQVLLIIVGALQVGDQVVQAIIDNVVYK
jgi:hypothetical protein